MRDAPVSGSPPGRSATGQPAILWGGSDGGPADKAFSFEDFPLGALLGRSAAESDALPRPLVPVEVYCSHPSPPPCLCLFRSGCRKSSRVLPPSNAPPHASLQADSPSRMSRQGAARTYHTYLSWGYFQRRMAQQRESASLALSSSAADSGASSACPCCGLGSAHTHSKAQDSEHAGP